MQNEKIAELGKNLCHEIVLGALEKAADLAATLLVEQRNNLPEEGGDFEPTVQGMVEVYSMVKAVIKTCLNAELDYQSLIDHANHLTLKRYDELVETENDEVFTAIL